MIVCRSATELDILHRANQIVARVLGEVGDMVRPGVSTEELDAHAEARIRELGGEPAFKGYRGFPKTLCTSFNEEIIHGIPSPRRKVAPGDILGIDVGVRLEGYYGDSATTVPVPPVDPRVGELLRVTEESLWKAIEQCRPGNRLGDVSSAVQRHVEEHGFSVVREFVGHGIGRSLHEDLQIPNYGSPGVGPRLRPGMVMAIEPMVNMGGPEVVMLEDGWTAVTQDRKPSAHFEHSVAVTEEGPWVLSLPADRAGRVSEAGSAAAMGHGSGRTG